jgi:hypothetical protein
MDELEAKLRPWRYTAYLLAGIALAIVLYVSLAPFLGK